MGTYVIAKKDGSVINVIFVRTNNTNGNIELFLPKYMAHRELLPY